MGEAAALRSKGVLADKGAVAASDCNCINGAGRGPLDDCEPPFCITPSGCELIGGKTMDHDWVSIVGMVAVL